MAVFTDEFIQRCRRHVELREERDIADAKLKKLKDAYNESESELWEMLAPADPNAPDYKLSPVKVPLGQPWGTVSFGPRETIYARVINEDDASEHYANRALLDEVSGTKFVMKRLNEEVRELHEQGKSMPPGLDYYVKRFVAITKQK